MQFFTKSKTIYIPTPSCEPHLSCTHNSFPTSVLPSHAPHFAQFYPHRRFPSVIDRWGPLFTKYMHRVVSLTSGPHEKLSPFILHQPSRSRSGREGRAPCARGLLPAAAGRPAACLCTASLRASPPPYRRRAPLHCGSGSLRTRPASPRLPAIRLPAARVRPPPLSAPLLHA